MTTIAVRYDFAAALVDDESKRQRAAEILCRECLGELERVSSHRGDRWLGHAQKTAGAIEAILHERKNAGASFDTGRGKEIVAAAEIKNGTWETGEGSVRFNSWLAFPHVRDKVDQVVQAVCDLADVLDVGAGFVAAEPNFNFAQNVALGGSLPKMRGGLSTRRAIERRGRSWHRWQIHNELAGIEWGTFLGAAHLARIDLERVRASEAFARVVSISPRLAFLQVTSDPADDLSEDFDGKLDRAREVLAPVMMDLSDVNLSD